MKSTRIHRSERALAAVTVAVAFLITASIVMAADVSGNIRNAEDGATVDIYRSPKHPYTSGLLGSIPAFTRGRLRPIEGETPELFDVVEGCRFADRCQYAIDRCLTELPLPRLVESTLVACHRADELELEGVG